MSGSCTYPGCTVDETGICALERAPATCGNRVTTAPGESARDGSDVEQIASVEMSDVLGSPVLDAPVQASAFPSSRALGLDDLSVMMGARYVSVVGILGDPESGKTACLASLYLLVSHAKLDGWSFADSRTLTAFEEIARGARDWNNGHVPDQMTVHTELADGHGPGFLHLRLVRTQDKRRVDLALPDIPGEWTQALVSTAQTERLAFLKSADVIWIVLDGRSLADIERRHGVIARLGQLVARLNTMLGTPMPRLMIVVTHHDMHALSPEVADRLKAALAQRGAQGEIVSIAPFSDRPDEVPAGFGIADLIDRTVGRRPDRPVFWQASKRPSGSRAYLDYRRDE